MARKWFRCEVKKTGPAANENNTIYIALSDVEGKFDNQWFFADTKSAKEMLATSLAAMSTGYQVDADLEDPPNECTAIERLYLVKP